jgi:hypothetical protein
LTLYENSINRDFKVIRDAGYNFVVIVIPLADHNYPYYYPNINLINRLAVAVSVLTVDTRDNSIITWAVHH